MCPLSHACRLHAANSGYIDHVKLDVLIKMNCTSVTCVSFTRRALVLENVHPSYNVTLPDAICGVLKLAIGY